MEIVQQEYALVDVDSLERHPENARRGDLDAIDESIETNGFYGALIVQKSRRRILAGEHRWRTAKQKGAPQVPAIIADVDDDTAARIVAADNRTSDRATYEDRALRDFLQGIQQREGTLVGTGFVDDDLAGLSARLREMEAAEAKRNAEPDDVPDVPVNPITAPGDLIILGEHRLLCGDARDPDAYDVLLDGERAQCVWTDPPYGVDVQERDLQQAEVRGRRKDGKGVLNDDLTGTDLATLLQTSFAATIKRTQPGAPWYVCAPPGVDVRHFLNALADIGVARHGLVWLKDRFVMGRADYHYRHEILIYGWTPGGAHLYSGDRTRDSVFEFDRPGRSPEHPTMKPVALVADCLSTSSKGGDIVLDPFLGSGSTVIAAETLGRRCFGLELDPSYCDVVVTRWENFTGLRAARLAAPVSA